MAGPFKNYNYTLDDVTSSNYVPPEPNPITYQVNSGASGNLNLNTVVSNSGSYYTAGTHAPPLKPMPAPVAPNLSNLRRQQQIVQNKAALKQAMKDYDALEASTVAAGMQSASNAGSVYSQRMIQAGINPVASGVVEAQAKMPVYQRQAEIRADKDRVRLEHKQRADALSAEIAKTIASLRMSYVNTLADYNKAATGYELDLNKFNASQDARRYEYEETRKDEKARLAAALAASGKSLTGTPIVPTINPGYIPSFGPMTPATINGVQQPYTLTGF